MGLGIGGDYPLSAVISSEFAATKFRGRMMAGVLPFKVLEISVSELRYT